MKQILIKPVITEKAIIDLDNKLYTFQVHRNATKHQIQEAVKALFDVDVYSVQITTRKGKAKRVGRMRRLTTTKPRKFARVKIGRDQTIDAFSVVSESEKEEKPVKKQEKKQSKKDTTKTKKETKKKDK